MIRVLFFGPLTDRIREREMQFDFAQGLTLQDIAQRVGTQYPDILRLISFIALNQQQVRDMQLFLRDGDEIAFMAKFSGG